MTTARDSELRAVVGLYPLLGFVPLAPLGIAVASLDAAGLRVGAPLVRDDWFVVDRAGIDAVVRVSIYARYHRPIGFRTHDGRFGYWLLRSEKLWRLLEEADWPTQTTPVRIQEIVRGRSDPR